MHQNLLIVLSLFVLPGLAFSQDNRSIDGTGNNPFYTGWGAAGTNLKYETPIGFTDGISMPAGFDRPNAREISNALFAQPGLINDPMGLSDFIWVFGQFLDHDITLTEGSNEFFPIPVPTGDVHFDPFFTGNQIIPLNRSEFDPSTGTSPANHRKSPNKITAFIDGSAVYGETQQKADWLRTFQGGKLKSSAGNLLPYNTTTGEFDDPIDPDAPHMADDVGMSPKLFVAGDFRANEQPLLLGFHTLFMREHNRLCDVALAKHPDWSDEQLYQYARKMVSGYFQNIVYNEWLPAMGVNLPAYGGYRLNVDPRISNVFSGAAFRLGHTLLNPVIRRLDENGDVIPEGNLTLRQAFFNPSRINEGGLDPLFKGMAEQVQQGMDNKVVDDVRNFLFGPPGAGGLDLAAINIQRGRDRGIADFNTVRVFYGLPAYTSFDQIVTEPAAAQAFSDIYDGDVNKIDPWVGMLTEDPMPGALFGETIMAIMKSQFSRLRDGDRYFFMNDPVLSDTEKNEIKNTRMVDIIRRNTGVTIVQDNVFGAMDHVDVPTCTTSNTIAEIKGKVHTILAQPIDSVKIEMFDGVGMMPHSMSVNNGEFDFGQMETCNDYTLIPYKNDDADNGVNTLDLILTQYHILNIQKFNSPYQMLAADADNSGHISSADLVNMRQVILHVRESFYNNKSWRFIPVSYVFPNPSNPFVEVIPESIMIDLHAINADENFTGIKVGDVDNSADPLNELSERPVFVFNAMDQAFEPGERVVLSLTSDEVSQLIGGQFTFNYDPAVLELTGIRGNRIPGFTEQSYNAMSDIGVVTFSWDGEIETIGNEEILTFEFIATSGSSLSNATSVNSRYTMAQVYKEDLTVMDVALRFDTDEKTEVASFELYQNVPNPVKTSTRIEYYMPEAAEAVVTIADATGKVLLQREVQAIQGLNAISLNRQSLSAPTGLLIYTVETEFGSQTRKMILVD